MRILVCGGRQYIDYITVNKVLGDIVDGVEDIDKVVIIQGGAKGADFLARVFAYCYNGGCAGILCEEYPADWKKYGRGAGPIRNQQMLDEGKPDLVVAFPGKTGTADMVRRATSSGVEVLNLTQPTPQV